MSGIKTVTHHLLVAALTCLVVLGVPNGHAEPQPILTGFDMGNAAQLVALPIDKAAPSAPATTGQTRAMAMMGDEPLPPVPEKTDKRYSRVDAGGESTCGIRKQDKGIDCWGLDEFGQSSPPIGRFRTLSMGKSHGCAITEGRNLICWGLKTARPTEEEARGHYISVAAGDDHTCAIRTDKTLACWGNDDNGELRFPAGKYKKVVARGNHSCAISTRNLLQCWGEEAFTGFITNITFPVSRVATGQLHGCALRTDTHQAVCWGNGADGKTDAPADRFIDLVAGDWHTCGIRPDRTAVCWGENHFGQTLIGTERFWMIAAGGTQTCGILRASKRVVCFGSFASDSWFYPQDPLAESKASAIDGVVRPQLAFLTIFEGVAGFMASALVNGGKAVDQGGQKWEGRMVKWQLAVMGVSLLVKWIWGGKTEDSTKTLLANMQADIDHLKNSMVTVLNKLNSIEASIATNGCDISLQGVTGAINEIQNARKAYEAILADHNAMLTAILPDKTKPIRVDILNIKAPELAAKVKEFKTGINKDGVKTKTNWEEELGKIRTTLQNAYVSNLPTSPLTACLDKGYKDWRKKAAYPFDDRPIYSGAYLVLKQALLAQAQILSMQHEFDMMNLYEAFNEVRMDESGKAVPAVYFDPNNTFGICAEVDATLDKNATSLTPMEINVAERWNKARSACQTFRAKTKETYLNVVKQIEFLGGAYSTKDVVMSMTSEQMGITQPSDLKKDWNYVAKEANWLWLRNLPANAFMGSRMYYKSRQDAFSPFYPLIAGPKHVELPASAQNYLYNGNISGEQVWHSNGQAWKDLYSIRAKHRTEKLNATDEDVLEKMEALADDYSTCELTDTSPKCICVNNDVSGACTAKKAKLFTGIVNKPFWMSDQKNNNEYDYIYDARYKAEGGGEDINYNYLNKIGLYCYLGSGIHDSKPGDNWYHPKIKAGERELLKLKGKACSPEEMAATLGYWKEIINESSRFSKLIGVFKVSRKGGGVYSYSYEFKINGGMKVINGKAEDLNYMPYADGQMFHMPVVKINGRVCNESMIRDVNGKSQIRSAVNKVGLPTICGDDLDDVIYSLAPRPEFPPIPDSEVRVLAPRSAQ
jgi:hypothetical protein